MTAERSPERSPTATSGRAQRGGEGAQQRDRGRIRHRIDRDWGNYTLPQLPAGLIVTATGFKGYEQTGVTSLLKTEKAAQSSNINRMYLNAPSSGNSLAAQVRSNQGIATSGFGYVNPGSTAV